MKSVNITIIEAPIWVEFTCPECRERIDMDYNHFCFSVVNLNTKGEGENFNCPHCKKELNINCINFD